MTLLKLGLDQREIIALIGHDAEGEQIAEANDAVTTLFLRREFLVFKALGIKFEIAGKGRK
jgi:hypothetical protein